MDQQQLRRTIASAKAGDPAGYETLLSAYSRRLYGYFLRATGNHHDAEDLLGEITLRLVQRLRNYDDRGRFDHWLFRIAANMVRDRIRRIKAAPAIRPLGGKDDSGNRLAEDIDDESLPVESGLLSAEASDQLQALLKTLDETTRQMILLRHLGQMSFKDLAELYNCPLGTVLARVHRGLRALRGRLKMNDGTE